MWRRLFSTMLTTAAVIFSSYIVLYRTLHMSDTLQTDVFSQIKHALTLLLLLK